MYLLIAILLIAAIYSTKITSKFGVPVLLLFLGIGMLCGSDVLNLIYFDNAYYRVANIFLIFIIRRWFSYPSRNSAICFRSGFDTRDVRYCSDGGNFRTSDTFYYGARFTLFVVDWLHHFFNRCRGSIYDYASACH